MAKKSSTGKTKSAAKPAARKTTAAVKGAVKGNNARKTATAGVAANRPPARTRAVAAETKSTAMGLKKKAAG